MSRPRMMLLSIGYDVQKELCRALLKRETFAGAGTVDIHFFSVLVLRLSAAELLPKDAIPCSAWDWPMCRSMELAIYSEHFAEVEQGARVPSIKFGKLEMSNYRNRDGRVVLLPDWAWAAIDAAER